MARLYNTRQQKLGFPLSKEKVKQVFSLHPATPHLSKTNAKAYLMTHDPKKKKKHQTKHHVYYNFFFFLKKETLKFFNSFSVLLHNLTSLK